MGQYLPMGHCRGIVTLPGQYVPGGHMILPPEPCAGVFNELPSYKLPVPAGGPGQYWPSMHMLQSPAWLLLYLPAGQYMQLVALSTF